MRLMDANTFMEAARSYYPFDFAPGFWAWLTQAHMGGHLASIEAIRDEISQGDPQGKNGDPLVAWAKSMPSSFWLPDTSASAQFASYLAQWAVQPGQPYGQPAVAAFMSSADLRLVAIAKTTNATVVTREVAAPGSKKSIKIPDVCAAAGVHCEQPWTAYRALGMRL